MELFNISNTSLLYFSIASVFILYSVLRNENISATVISKVNANFTKLLFVNGIILVLFYGLAVVIEKFSLNSIPYIRGVFCVLGFATGFCSFLCPFYMLILFKKFIYGKNFLEGSFRKLLFFIFVSTASLYILLSIKVTYIFIQGGDVTVDYLSILLIIPAVSILNYCVVFNDLRKFLNELFVNSFISKRVGFVIQIFFLVGPFITFIVGWLVLAPMTYGLMVAFVFLVQIVTHDRAVSIDFLTGLNNRKELVRYLNRLFEKTSELDKNLHLIFIDINDFKTVNDTYGHNQGDKALLAIAKCMKQSAFDKDCFLSRYAGDEFTVVIKEKPSHTVDMFVDSLKTKLEIVNESDEMPFDISLSVGIVPYSEQYTTIDDFIAAADEAMYENKVKVKGLDS